VKKVSYSRDALRTLSRIPVKTAKLIQAKIEQYASDPTSLANNTKALKGMPGLLRLRVGDWRVIFSETGEVIAVIRIAPRGSAYE
jgi:mRNA interferase RelE/StbE